MKNETTNKQYRVWFYPVYTRNEYTNIMQYCINEAGYKTCLSNSFYELFKADIIHLNWYDNLSKNKVKRVAVFIYKITQLLIMRIQKKPIVTTFHNKANHDKSGDKLERIIKDLSWKESSKIILHSKSSMRYLPSKEFAEKSYYIPHPNYCSAYKGGNEYTKYEKLEGKLTVLLFGMIRKYKNTELFIKLANDYANYDNVDFIICGNCDDDKYIEELKKCAKSGNILFDIRYIRNDEIESLFSVVDICVLPYCTVSSLNSGVALLAFSFGVTVLSTKTATIEDLEDSNLVYSYEYVDDEMEHYRRMKNEFDNVYNDFCKNSNVLKNKGKRLKEKVMREANYMCVSKGLHDLYTLLLN